MWPILGEAPWEETKVVERVVQRTVEVRATPYQRRLTGPEAEALTLRTMNYRHIEEADKKRAEQTQDPFPAPVLQPNYNKCEAVDFNEAAKAWIVRCSGNYHVWSSNRIPPQEVPIGAAPTYRLYDITREVESVR